MSRRSILGPLTWRAAPCLLGTGVLTMVAQRWRLVVLVLMVPLFAGATCNSGSDPAGDGTLQLFYNVNVDAAAAMGLGNLAALVVQSGGLTADFTTSGGVSTKLVLDPQGGTTTLSAHDRLLPGPSYSVAPGFIEQLRIVDPIVTFQLNDGSSLPVRVPSGAETGWKIIVDNSVAPNGYQIVAGHTTGVELFLTLGDLFHETGGGGAHGHGNGVGNSGNWMARPTIKSTLYNIVAQAGYDPDILVVVFDPATDDLTISNAIISGGYTVVDQYPKAPPKLYKVKLPTGGNLQDAHAYFRGLAYVLAAAPSVVMNSRTDTVPPTEGTPAPLAAINATTGWTGVETTTPKKTVGLPDTVLAEISLQGLNTHHPSLVPNVWLNQGEILPTCPLAQCDVDGDGFVTLRDFNSPNIPARFVPAHSGPQVTCDDLLASSLYVTGMDRDGNGFKDDLCGWNFAFSKGSPAATGGTVMGGGVFSNSDHDTAVAGVMAARADLAPTTTVPPGAGVGVCWNCRLMVVEAASDESSLPDGGFSEHGLTFEFLEAIAYAAQNGAHVANYSAGITLNPSNDLLCGSGNGTGQSVDKAAFSTIKQELTSALQSALDGVVAGGGHIPLFTLAIEDRCSSSNVDDGNPDNFDYPSAAFRGSSYSDHALTVAGSVNTSTDPGPFAGPSSCVPNNLGADIGAPEVWEGLLLDGGDSAAMNGGGGVLGCSGLLPGSSTAAPVVAGVAGLVVSGNLSMFKTPDGAALRSWILAHDVSANSALQPGVPSGNEITMQFLP